LRVEKAVNEELRSQLRELTRHLQVAYIVFDKHGLTLEIRRESCTTKGYRAPHKHAIPAT
jgi:hypothetical protein